MKKGNTWVVMFYLFVFIIIIVIIIIFFLVICDSNVLIGPQFRAFRLGPEGT